MYFQDNMLDSNDDGTLERVGDGPSGRSDRRHHPVGPVDHRARDGERRERVASDIAQAGALLRDDVDALVIADVTSLGTKDQLWTSQSSTNLANGGYGTLTGGTAPADTDGDGILDAWETANGLNPNDDSLM
jgi:hypothetical protein